MEAVKESVRWHHEGTSVRSVGIQWSQVGENVA